MAEISIAEVDQAEAALQAAKAAHYEDPDNAEKTQALATAKDDLVAVRRAWREQEVAAGRRGAGVTVGGDAAKEE